jgi:hypothetical protein
VERGCAQLRKRPRAPRRSGHPLDRRGEGGDPEQLHHIAALDGPWRRIVDVLEALRIDQHSRNSFQIAKR